MQENQTTPPNRILRRWRDIIFISRYGANQTSNYPSLPNPVPQMDLAEAIQALTLALDAALEEARQDSSFRAPISFEG
ncbi:MAG: hypothetical protein FVQ83_14040 [Chloroflexi bacterium]|nr:hypothetical protein [Chloroflexota bacterium]